MSFCVQKKVFASVNDFLVGFSEEDLLCVSAYNSPTEKNILFVPSLGID